VILAPGRTCEFCVLCGKNPNAYEKCKTAGLCERFDVKLQHETTANDTIHSTNLKLLE
jgi:hypothetical protein